MKRHFLAFLILLGLLVANAQTVPGSYVVQLTPVEPATAAAMQDAAAVLERRLENLPLTDWSVEVADQLSVKFDLSDGVDLERVLEQLVQPGRLEFRLVKSAVIPEEVITLRDLEPAVFDNSSVSGASVVLSEYSGPVVQLDIARAAQQRFGSFTENFSGRRLAIVLDGEILVSPVLQGRITESAQISGDFSLEEANDMASRLQSGVLPVRLEISEVIEGSD